MAACTLCTHTHTLIRGMVALLLLDLKICQTVRKARKYDAIPINRGVIPRAATGGAKIHPAGMLCDSETVAAPLMLKPLTLKGEAKQEKNDL